MSRMLPAVEVKGRVARAACLGATLLLTLCAEAVPGLAASKPARKVLLLRPVPTGEALAETILRIKSELSAGGFDVTVADQPGTEPDADRRALVEQAGQAVGAVAAVGVFGDLERGAAELWVVERITGQPATWHLEVRVTPDRRISEVLAVRVQELLRASQLELGLAADRPAPPPPPAPLAPLPRVASRPVEAAPQPSLGSWALAVEAGAAGLGGLGGFDPALAACARLRVALGQRLWLRLSAMGLGTRPTVHADFATATVNQSLLLVEGAVWLRPGRRVRPLFSVGLGGEHVAVTGSIDPPFHGEQNARWFVAADVGTGIALRLLAHWEVLLEAHALFTAPRPAVRFFDVEAARAGQPTLLVVLTLAGGA